MVEHMVCWSGSDKSNIFRSLFDCFTGKFTLTANGRCQHPFNSSLELRNTHSIDEDVLVFTEYVSMFAYFPGEYAQNFSVETQTAKTTMSRDVQLCPFEQKNTKKKADLC